MLRQLSLFFCRANLMPSWIAQTNSWRFHGVRYSLFYYTFATHFELPVLQSHAKAALLAAAVQLAHPNPLVLTKTIKEADLDVFGANIHRDTMVNLTLSQPLLEAQKLTTPSAGFLNPPGRARRQSEARYNHRRAEQLTSLL